MRIVDITLIGALRLRARSEQEQLSEIAGRSVESAARRFGECGYLIGARFKQIGKNIITVDGINSAFIARTGQQGAVLIKSKGVDKVIARAPDAQRRTIGRNAVDLRSASVGKDRGREQRSGRRRSSAQRDGALG